MGSLLFELLQFFIFVLSQKVWQRFFSFSNCLVVSIFPSAGHSVLAGEWLIIEYCPVWSVVVVCCCCGAGVSTTTTHIGYLTPIIPQQNSVHHTKYKILNGEMIPKWLRVSTLIRVWSRRDRRKHPLSHLPARGAPSQMKEGDGKLEQMFPGFNIYYRAVVNVKCQGFTYPPCLQLYGALEPDCVLTRRWSLEFLNIYRDTLRKLLLSKILKVENL